LTAAVSRVSFHPLDGLFDPDEDLRRILCGERS
jgi:hypothetical protein